ncbi:hypothetical protein [Sphaerisporangium aureirubrum]|uniref:Uncharacterized protein n=1 Tax=Sphaerisporangium aureirubrum TaxID=1544736 RepID=A0ABW1NAS5_9ACTN
MPRLISMITIIAVLAIGCGLVGGDVDKPTMTQAQALTRVEQLINGTVAALTPKPRLELDRPSLNLKKCLNPTDGGSEERVIVDRGYYLRDIPGEKIGEVARQIKEYWQRQRYSIEGISKNGLNLTAHSKPDDFLLALGRTGDDVLLLGVSSPCVWPNGTPKSS